MQTTSVFLAAVLVVAAAAAEHPRTPRTYKIDIQPGWNLIANQVDIGNNSITEVLPPSSLQFGSAVYVWADSVWSAELLVDDWIPGVAFLPPGTGFLLYYTGEDPIKLTFTGTWHEPQLPLPIEPDHWYLVACQEPKPARYQDIVGLDPVPGVEIWILGGTDGGWIKLAEFVGDHWEPKEPKAKVGEAWFIYVPVYVPAGAAK